MLEKRKVGAMQQNATECNKIYLIAFKSNKMLEKRKVGAMQQNATKCYKMHQNALKLNKMLEKRKVSFDERLKMMIHIDK